MFSYLSINNSRFTRRETLHLGTAFPKRSIDITPAKKVAMALSELILTRYPKDTLDIIVFGNDAGPLRVSRA